MNELEAAQQYISDPDIIVSVYGLNIIWASEKLANITGYSKEELLSMKASQIVSIGPKEIAGLVKSRILQNSGEVEFKGKTKDGKKISLKILTKVFGLGVGLFIVGKFKENKSGRFNMFF